MNVIKRNGSEVTFDKAKIENAIIKANNSVEEAVRLTPIQIKRITDSVILSCEDLGRSPAVEEIQDMVEEHIMQHGAYEVAKHISHTDIQDPSFVSPTQQMTRFFRLSSLTTRKLSRRTPIRILLSTPLRETTWLER